MTIKTMSEYRAYISQATSRKSGNKQDPSSTYFIAGYTEAARVVREQKGNGIV
jgi:hypothetical protein